MLHVHRSERADGLVEALRALLADPLPDPFAAEVVAVPTRGMERWLTQRLSARLGARPGRADGICANVGFPFPRALVGDAVAAAAGVDPEADPWLPERAVWPLLEVVGDCLEEPWLARLAAHLGESDDAARRARRFATVRHLAGLFDRYGLERPDMVLAWAAGRDAAGAGAAGVARVGVGGAPGDGAAWQAELWRRLRERIGTPSPAERLAGACARLEADPAVVALPARVSLFGLTRLPAGHLRVLAALAAGRDVHVWILHPSPRLWERVSALTAARPPVVRRIADPTATLPTGRLLASWGHDVRELQLVLAAAGPTGHHHPVEHGGGTLLARIQAAVREDRAPQAAPLSPGDRSVEVHACHGRARQVEVVRDAILQALAEDPTLEPRDVIVMCPDVEAFAPLIHATFGAGEVTADDDELETVPPELRPPDLRVRLADRSLRQTNPILGVVATLIELAGQRLTASQVLDLAAREPVRRRFRLDDDDLGRVEDWVRESGIRWGLDGEQRAPFRLGGIAAGTWRTGLDRVLLGVTMTEDEHRLFCGVLPLDDVDSGAIDLAGRFAELVDRLDTALAGLRAPQPVAAWAAALGAAVDALTATTQRDAWQRSELQRLLADVVAEAAGEGGPILALGEVRSLLAERLQGRPTRANFRTGHLTICTLVPMRSVPHRIVCLLGLDDGVFPRRSPRDGDDLVLDDPHVGDRDPRAEDRQLLLDALMAATERLVVTYTGNDERTNVARPPAVPVGELLDEVERAAPGADVVTRHPLQPFDPRNFTPGALVRGRPWSFDRVALEGARALEGERAEPGPFLAGPLPAATPALVELEDVLRFTAHPVRAFLRRRLGVGVGDFEDEIEDGLPVELGPLEQWRVGDRILVARMEGASTRTAYLAELARGGLPPDQLAKPVVQEIVNRVEAVVRDARALLGDAPPGSVDVKVVLPDGRRLSGTVPGVAGDVLRSVSYARVSPRHRLAAWVRLLALTAAHPERPFEAVTIGRASDARRAEVTIARIPPLAADPAGRRERALARLAVLLDLQDRGLREPPPLACRTSAAYAAAAATGGDAVKAGRDAWQSAHTHDKEDAEPEHELVLGGRRTFAELLAEPPRSDEEGDGWRVAETTRFGRHARRLWDGLLAVEELTHR